MVADHQGCRHQGGVNEVTGFRNFRVFGNGRLKRARTSLRVAVMPRNDEIEFWYSVGSTYTDLTARSGGSSERCSLQVAPFQRSVDHAGDEQHSILDEAREGCVHVA